MIWFLSYMVRKIRQWKSKSETKEKVKMVLREGTNIKVYNGEGSVFYPQGY